MSLSPELRTALHANSELFTPAWVMAESEKLAEGDFRIPKIELNLREGVPILYSNRTGFKGEAETAINFYVGWVKAAVLSSADGRPVLDGPDATVSKLCEAIGTIVVTTKRTLFNLGAGIYLGQKFESPRGLVMSLPHEDLVSIDLEISKKMFGGHKHTGTVVTFARTSVGQMHFNVERGFNDPYNRDDRGIWGRDAQMRFYQTLVEGATGTRPAENETRSAPNGAPDAAKQASIQVKMNPFLQ